MNSTSNIGYKKRRKKIVITTTKPRIYKPKDEYEVVEETIEIVIQTEYVIVNKEAENFEKGSVKKESEKNTV